MLLITATVYFLYLLKSVIGNHYSVIIIGAGPAGVAAASKLLEENITNILVLEAEPRIGGRIHSVFFGDAYVELGAQWCHGKQHNIVYELASPLVSLKVDEEELIPLYTNEELNDTFISELNELLLNDYHNEPEDGNLTLEEFILPRYEASAKIKYSNQPNKLKIALSAKRLLEQYLLSYEGAFYLNNVTAISDFVYEKNDSDYSWQGIGYKTILDILIHKFPNESNALPFYEKLKLNEEVVKIHWNENIVVDVKSGTSYHGDRLIFTPSLNVLKQDNKKLFVPELPGNKQEAMEDLGMDGVMKIHAHFQETWWPNRNEFNGYGFIWDEEDLQEVQRTKYAWIVNICCMIPADRNPKVLSAWLTGPQVPEIELLSNEELAKGIEFLLKTFLQNKYNITTPDMILKSGWYNNPHFRGVYSYQTVRAQMKKPSPEVTLAEPLSNEIKKDVLCFAGEATHPHFYSTVHGAIESGFREARRIIANVKLE